MIQPYRKMMKNEESVLQMCLLKQTELSYQVVIVISSPWLVHIIVSDLAFGWIPVAFLFKMRVSYGIGKADRNHTVIIHARMIWLLHCMLHKPYYEVITTLMLFVRFFMIVIIMLKDWIWVCFGFLLCNKSLMQ